MYQKTGYVPPTEPSGLYQTATSFHGAAAKSTTAMYQFFPRIAPNTSSSIQAAASAFHHTALNTVWNRNQILNCLFPVAASAAS